MLTLVVTIYKVKLRLIVFEYEMIIKVITVNPDGECVHQI